LRVPAGAASSRAWERTVRGKDGDAGRWGWPRLARLLPLLAIGCAPPSPRDAAAIDRAVLTTLFAERERGTRLVLYAGPSDSALTLQSAVLPAGAVLRRASVDGVPLSVELVGPSQLTAHFRAHPEAWRAWFERFPGSAGLVERTEPAVEGARATMLVGRACGEHCRMAWRVTLLHGAGAWRVQQVMPVPLPPS
jgi:hypothetical protein